MTALLISVDLMTTSQAQGAAARAGVSLAIAPPAKAPEVATSAQPVLAVIDLQGPVKDLPGLVASLREASPDAKIAAFGPHVQTILLASARDAGCDKVITRGQFHREFEGMLSQLGVADESAT